MVEHSKAPFRADTDRSPAYIRAADEGAAIATVFLTDPNTKKRSAKHMANLALFLAAPDTLAALRSVVSEVQRLGLDALHPASIQAQNAAAHIATIQAEAR